MDKIKKIFTSLSKTEKRYLKTYLEAFHTKGENKALQLIELIEKKPGISQPDLATKLYGSPGKKAFIMLKSRLLEKMLDVLTMSLNLHNNPTLKDDPPVMEMLLCYKNYISAIMLRRRGLGDISEDLLKKALKQAEELSYPEAKLMTLLQLRNLSASKQEVSWNYKIEIEKTLRQYENDIIGVGYYDEFRVNYADKSSTAKEAVQDLVNATNHLEQLLEKEYSVRSHYFYLSLLVYLHTFKHNYVDCKETLKELIDLLETHPGMSARNRKGVPYVRLSSAELRMFNFDAAFDAAQKAMEILNSRRSNYLSALIYYLYACIFTNRIQEANASLELAEGLLAVATNPTSIAIIKYLESCIKFIEGDIWEANKTLMEADRLLDDKKGWNVGMRIFEIIILLDMDKMDLAGGRIENLRKHLGRHEGSKRENNIYRYLSALERQAFDFDNPSKDMDNYLNILENETPWNPVGHEVIRFDTWVRTKSTSEPYYPAFLEELSPVAPS